MAFLKLTAFETHTGGLFATLAIPVLLAIGNIHRSRAWPTGARPDALSPAMLMASALLLIVFGPLTGLSYSAPVYLNQYGLIAVQAGVFAVQYLLFFVLQQRGGPVLLSLMGAVAAIVSVLIAVFVQQETAPPGLAIVAALIGGGVTLMAVASRPTR
jgi:drug/metabolite transporter (DMT)-like permease